VDNLPPEAVPNPEQSDQPQKDLSKVLWDILEILVLSALLFLGINAISARIRVDGSSMEPTLHNGEFIIVNRLAYKLGKPARGDIIVLTFPKDSHQEYIKRIIGLPGDRIEIINRNLYINNQLAQESYIKMPPSYTGQWNVPDDSLFVLGDNRNNSSDSHNGEFVPLNHVVGKALVVYWPPSSLRVIKHLTPILPSP
jgi:signal peptidase I